MNYLQCMVATKNWRKTMEPEFKTQDVLATAFGIHSRINDGYMKDNHSK